jgi:hypothetical protein
MSDKQNAKALPTHRIYSVSKNGEKKSVWTEIGAAWPHKDGKGFNLNFTARPLEGAQLVLRLATAKKTGVTSTRQTAGRYAELNAATAGKENAE